MSRLRVSGWPGHPASRTAGHPKSLLLDRGQVAEIVLDRLAVAGRQACGQLLQRLLLLAWGETAPLLTQLRHLGRVDVARAARALSGGARTRWGGRLHA